MMRDDERSTGTAPAALRRQLSILFLSLSPFFSQGISGPALLPPSSGWLGGGGHPPLASARGLAVGGGQFSRDFIVVEVAGGDPKVDLNWPKRPGPLPPLFSATRRSED